MYTSSYSIDLLRCVVCLSCTFPNTVVCFLLITPASNISKPNLSLSFLLYSSSHSGLLLSFSLNFVNLAFAKAFFSLADCLQ